MKQGLGCYKRGVVEVTKTMENMARLTGAWWFEVATRGVEASFRWVNLHSVETNESFWGTIHVSCTSTGKIRFLLVISSVYGLVKSTLCDFA